MTTTEQKKFVLDTKYGQLQFTEGECGTTNVFTTDEKYITCIKAKWWDLDGIYAQLNNERVEDLIWDKLNTNRASVLEKVETAFNAVKKLGDDELNELAEQLLVKVREKSKR